MQSRFNRFDLYPQNEADIYSSKILRANKSDVIIRAIIRLFTVCATLMIASLIAILWLTTGSVPQPIWAQARDSANAEIDITSFPILTVSFDCDVVQADTSTFHLSEDGQSQIINSADVNVDGPPTQVALFLDLFRDRESKLPSAMTDLLFQEGDANDLLDYLKEFGDKRNPTYIIAGRDSLGIFVPDRDLVTPRPLLATKHFTYDLNSLINGLNDIREIKPGGARLVERPTTGFVDSLLQLLEYFDNTRAAQRIVVVFSDGTDEISPQENREQLIATARERGIPIYTAFVATSTPGDVAFLHRLAEQTGGQVVVVHDADREQLNSEYLLKDLLPVLFPKPPRCQIGYRTIQAFPKQVDIYDDGDKGNRIASGVIPKIAVLPPIVTVTVNAPLQVSGTITATLTVTVTGELTNYQQRRIRNIDYKIKGPAPILTSVPITESARFTRTTVITVPNFITGSYLIQVQMIDDLGLVGEDTKPFGLYYEPPKPSEPPPPTLWQRFRDWMQERAIAFGKYTETREFAILEMILWYVIVFLVIGFLLRWLLHQPLVRIRERRAIANPKTEYCATLIRIHSDPKAPPLLPMVPLGQKETVNIPEDLYHPIWKHYQTSDAQKSFSEQYRATIEVEGTDQFFIDRGKLVGEEGNVSSTVERQEPISIQVAETAESFKLVSKEIEKRFINDAIRPRVKFGPLDHGDILQLGDTHYKFMRLNEKDEPKTARAALSSS